MPQSVNSVVLVGVLSENVVLRVSADGGKTTARVKVGTDEGYVDSGGVAHDKTELHAVVFFGILAEHIKREAVKGCVLRVQGRLSTRVWRDNRGHDHRSTEVIGESFSVLGLDDDKQTAESLQEHEDARHP